MQTRDSSPTVLQSRLTTSVESFGKGSHHTTTCHQVWSGSATGGSDSIISHRAMRFWPKTLSVCFRFRSVSQIMAPGSKLLGAARRGWNCHPDVRKRDTVLPWGGGRERL